MQGWRDAELTGRNECCDECMDPTRHEDLVQQHYRMAHENSTNNQAREVTTTRLSQNIRSRSKSPSKSCQHPGYHQSRSSSGYQLVNDATHTQWNQPRNPNQFSQQPGNVKIKNDFHYVNQKSSIPISGIHPAWNHFNTDSHVTRNQPNSDRPNHHITQPINHTQLEAHNTALLNSHKYPLCPSIENREMFVGYGMYPGNYPAAGIHLNIAFPTGFMNRRGTHSKNRNQLVTVASHHKVQSRDQNVTHQRDQNQKEKSSSSKAESISIHSSGCNSEILETNLDSPDEDESGEKANNESFGNNRSGNSNVGDTLITSKSGKSNNITIESGSHGYNGIETSNIGYHAIGNGSTGNNTSNIVSSYNSNNNDIPPLIPPKTYKQSYHQSDAKVMSSNVQKVGNNGGSDEEKVGTKEQHGFETKMNALWKETISLKDNGKPKVESWSESDDIPRGAVCDIQRRFTRSRSCVEQPPKVCCFCGISYTCQSNSTAVCNSNF